MTETMTSKMNVYPNLLKEFIKSILYSLISVGGNIFLTDKQVMDCMCYASHIIDYLFHYLLPLSSLVMILMLIACLDYLC